MTISVTLGSFVFDEDFEVPENIPIGGGEQRLNVHALVGDKRQIDAMGIDPEPIVWSGRFRGAEAQTRARAVEAIWKAGKPVTLAWDEYSFTVIVRAYKPEMHNKYEIPYAISCEVVSQADQASTGPSPDEQVQGDNASIQTLGSSTVSEITQAQTGIAAELAGITGPLSLLNNPEALAIGAMFAAISPLTGLLATLDAAVGAVPLFATADLSTLATVLGPLGDVQACVSAGIAACEDTLADASTLGGVVAGGRPSLMGASLGAQTVAMTTVADLYDLGNLTGRLATNLAAIGSGGAVVTVAGADLLALAAQYYGDPAEWVTIAKANGLTEPVLTGLRSILIPPTPSGTGGVLSEVIGSDQTALPEAPISSESEDGQLDWSIPGNPLLPGLQ